jgi:hypothetical protein
MGIFNRIFSRHAMNIALLMVIPMLIAPTLNFTRTLLVDPDIWWHLADARLLLTTHHFIQTDPYSFIVVGQRWLNWEWLAELPYWFSYQAFGLRGIYLVTWLVMCANALFLYWRGYRLSRHAGAALWAAVIGILLMTVNSGPRTIAIAYLAMSAELVILEAAEQGKTRLLWLLPPLFCLWINLHGTWLIGIVLLGLYIACGLFQFKMGVFEQEAFTASQRNRLLSVLGASVAALIVNPYGWRLMWEPFDMAFKQKASLSYIGEWQPLSLSMREGKVAVVAIVLMVLANAVRSRKWKVYELAFIFLAWYAAFAHLRFLFLAAVLTTPMLARDFERAFCIESDEKTIPAMNALMVAGAVCVMFFMFPNEAALKKMQAMMFPMHTIQAIQPSWRTLNWDYVGGMMDFQSKPSGFDTRLDVFEHAGVLPEYLAAIKGMYLFEVIEKYRIDHALIQESSPISYLLKQTPDWHIVMREKAWDGDDYVLYAKDSHPASASATDGPGTQQPHP